MNTGIRLFNRKNPAIAGRIPVNFIEPVKMTNLPGGGVGDHILMRPGGQKRILIPDIEPDAVRLPLRMIGFRPAIPGDAFNIEGDPVIIARAVLVIRRKIAIDAPADFPLFADDQDPLPDRQATVRMHADITGKIADIFRCHRRAGQQ